MTYILINETTGEEVKEGSVLERADGKVSIYLKGIPPRHPCLSGGIKTDLESYESVHDYVTLRWVES